MESVFAVSGFDLLSGGLKTSAGTMFIMLKDWKERTTPETDARNLPGAIMAMNAGIKDGLFCIQPATDHGSQHDWRF